MARRSLPASEGRGLASGGLDALAAVLPHRPPMLLLEELVSADPSRARARVTVRPDSPWVRDGILDRAAFIEIGAQTAAAMLGAGRADGARPVTRAFLGMASDCEVAGDAVAGDVLECTATVLMHMARLVRVTFDVRHGDRVLARGQLTLGWSDEAT